MKLTEKLYEWYDRNRYRYILPYGVREKYWAVRNFFFPKQRWLIKKIPKAWRDKDSLIELIVFECIKHYVSEDGEDALNVLCNDHPPHQKRFIAELKAMHGFITVKLPDLEKKLEEAYDKIPHKSFSDINKGSRADYEKTYGEVNRLEKRISDLKTFILEWAVKNREQMWT